eukprot:m.476569 g.476569  ORF g.476569 m.476569 type:complete len:413 (-) comp20570_c0_seq1:108-1346(-)
MSTTSVSPTSRGTTSVSSTTTTKTAVPLATASRHNQQLCPQSNCSHATPTGPSGRGTRFHSFATLLFARPAPMAATGWCLPTFTATSPQTFRFTAAQGAAGKTRCGTTSRKTSAFASFARSRARALCGPSTRPIRASAVETCSQRSAQSPRRPPGDCSSRSPNLLLQTLAAAASSHTPSTWTLAAAAAASLASATTPQRKAATAAFFSARLQAWPARSTRTAVAASTSAILPTILPMTNWRMPCLGFPLIPRPAWNGWRCPSSITTSSRGSPHSPTVGCRPQTLTRLWLTTQACTSRVAPRRRFSRQPRWCRVRATRAPCIISLRAATARALGNRVRRPSAARTVVLPPSTKLLWTTATPMLMPTTTTMTTTRLTQCPAIGLRECSGVRQRGIRRLVSVFIVPVPSSAAHVA